MGFVAAFTTAGHHRFTQQTGGCGTWINAIAVRDDSKLFVGGGYWNVGTIAHQTYTVTHYAYPNGATSPVLEEAFIATVEPVTGDWDWVRRVTGFNKDRINDIVIDSEHDALIAGNHLNNVSFETPGADCSPQSTAYTTNQCLRIAAGGDFDMFVAKISSDGDWMFADSFGGVNADGHGSTDFLQTITVDSNDNMYVMGSFTNNLILGTDYLPNTPQGPNYFVAKAANDPILSADGVTQELDWMWACQAGRVDNYGTEPFYGATYKRYAGLALDPQGIPIITGFFENSVKFDQDYISQTPNGEALKSTYIAKLSTTCAIPQPTPQHITVSNIYRDDVRLLSKFTNYSKEQVTDFNFAGKLVTVSVKSHGSYDVAIAAETSARHHGSDYGVPMKGTLSKLTIVDAGNDLSSQALLDATYSIDDFSDYGITLVSVSSDSFSKNENFTEKANTLQELIESGIFPIFEGEEKNGDSSDEEVEKARKPIKGYVYIRKTNRGVDTGEPTEMGVVAWGVKEAGDGNGYVVDDASHSLEGIKSEWATQVNSEDITDVCHTLLTTMDFLSEEDACISVLVEDLEKNVSQDGGGECYITSDPVKDQFYLGKESRNYTDDGMNISTSVKRVGDFSKFCAPSTEPGDEPNRGSQNCGTDVALSDLSVSTDMPFYEVGDDVTVTYAINCAVEPTNYTLKATTTRASNNEVISVQEYSIVASSLSEAIDEIHIDLDADVYCVEVYLTEANYPQLDDVSTCFVVSSQASSSGGGSLSGIGMFASLSTLLIVAFIGRRIRIDN